MIKKKLTSVALTGALALGGLGIGSMADLPISGLSATQADAATMSQLDFAEIYASPSYVLNALYIEGWAQGENMGMEDFYTGKHQARFTIQNSVGTIVKSGTLNIWEGRADHGLGFTYNFSNDTNISLAGLPKNGNQYRVKMSIPMDDGVVTNTKFFGLTKAFQYNADGTVSNFRD